MKGLGAVPQPKELLKAYARLTQAAVCTVSELALWAQWCRYDARLALLWVQYAKKKWTEIPPAKLREEILRHPWPATIGVLLGAVPEESAVYRYWQKAVTFGIKRAPGEQFFIGSRAIGGREMRKDAEQSLKLFLKWGYLSRENLTRHRPSGQRTALGEPERTRVLAELINSRERISVSDYMAACNGAVSRRTAARDLADHPRLVPVGRTRGRQYRKRTPR